MVKWLCLPGLSPYLNVIEEMDLAVNKIILGGQETVFLVEHTDTYTAGTSAKEEELIQPDLIPVYKIGRGGKYTYHGPGQRIIYPIINLSLENRKKDIKLYVAMLQETVIKTLKYYDICAYSSNENIGIWVKIGDEVAKIASIGIRVRKWVTYHGIAVNISTDLTKFKGIIPCGLSNTPITSLKELGINISLNEFDDIYKKYFIEVFE